MAREGFRAYRRMQLLHSAERCAHKIYPVSYARCRDMEKNAADSRIIDPSKVRFVLVKHFSEECSQALNLS